MKVIEIVKIHLETQGFDGLFNSNGQCACKTDDLEPCGNISSSCKAGYFSSPEEAEENGFDFMIGEKETV